MRNIHEVKYYYPPLKGPDTKALETAYLLIEENNKAIEVQKQNTLVMCYHCNHLSTIRCLEYIQTYCYVGPYGCTGGDYWNQGEGQYICPNCNKVVRLYNAPEIESLKNFFGNIRETRR